MISFKANYLNSAMVQQVNSQGVSAHKVSFVEINPKEISDIISVHKTAISWDKNGGEGFAYDICGALNQGINDRFFALTTQLENLKNLDFKQILGLAEVKPVNKKEVFVEYLQVNPECLSSAPAQKFKQVGTVLLNSLRNLFKANIELDSVKSAVGFYLKNGFVDIGSVYPDERRMRWVFKK